MKQELALSSLLLSAGLVSTTAQSAEFASADCVTGLNEIGLISVSNVAGNPQDVERIIALKADEQGASWYRIIQMYEEQQSDNWRVQAILLPDAAWLAPDGMYYRSNVTAVPRSPLTVNHFAPGQAAAFRRVYPASSDTTLAPAAARHDAAFPLRTPARKAAA